MAHADTHNLLPRLRQFPRALAHLCLNFGHDLFRFLCVSVDHQPSRALRHPEPENENRQPEHRACAENEPPSQPEGKHARVEQIEREHCAQCGANPVGAILLIDKSTCPRSRAGINSSIAELIAAYSPPMPAPVSARKIAKLQKFHATP